MAQVGNFSPIQLYSSSTPGNAPAVGNLVNSTLGSELAINIADGKLFYKDSANAIQVIAWKTTPTTAGGTGLTSYTAGDTLYYAAGAALSKLTIGANGYFMTSSGSAPQWTDPTGVAVTSISFGSTGLTPSTATKGAVTVAGTLVVGNGGTGLTTLTAGYIPFGNGTSAFGSTSNLFWNSSTNCLGIGLVNGTSKLEVAGAGANNAGARATYEGTIKINESGAFDLQSTGGLEFKGSVFASGYGSKIFSTDNGTMLFGIRQNSANWTEIMRLHGSGGVSIGNTTDPGAGNLGVNGGIRISGNSTAAGLTIANLSTPISNTTVNSTTYNVTFPTSAKVFWLSLGSGDGVLCVTNYVTSVVTILGTSAIVVNNSIVASNQLGVYKSANSHVVSFVTGSAATSTYGSWQIMSLSSTVA